MTDRHPDPRPDRSILLIATVGGSPEPLVATLRGWRPEKVMFVASADSVRIVTEDILPRASAAGIELGPAQWQIATVSDPQDLLQCNAEIRRAMAADVAEWLARGEDFDVVVDITGGTKCMTAALSLAAINWPCIFSYIGAAPEGRNRDGTGIVVSGFERLIESANPWDALGIRARNDAIRLFNDNGFAAAAQLLETAMRAMSSRAARSELGGLKLLSDAYDAWDRFDHDGARKTLDRCQRNLNDLKAVLTESSGRALESALTVHCATLDRLAASDGRDADTVADLLANARRRMTEGRFDDAVARLYRAIEAVAQLALYRDHDIETAAVPIDRVPDPLRDQWRPAAKDNGALAIGLMDGYALLAAFGNPLGARFDALDLRERTSPLQQRNHSILAHGFKPVSERTAEKLMSAAISLAELDEDDLQSFPLLEGRDG